MAKKAALSSSFILTSLKTEVSEGLYSQKTEVSEGLYSQTIQNYLTISDLSVSEIRNELIHYFRNLH